VICIYSAGENVNNSCYIGNIWSQPGGTQAVYVNGQGKLGAQVSSQRFKDEIKPMDQASEVIYGLKPVSFRYKPQIEPARLLGFGLIAEEVAQVNPDLITQDQNGEPYTVRYDAINAMLLNEFLKEHCTVQKQGAIIAEQQNQIEALTDQLKELAAQIQKVTAQIEIRQAAAQTALNNP
jgi:Chaperone of endosialidase